MKLENLKMLFKYDLATHLTNASHHAGKNNK